MPKLSKLMFFAATTDLWTSAAKHPYLSLTVHFISDEWSLETVCLDTVPLFIDHTGQNLAEAFQDVLGNWNLRTSWFSLLQTMGPISSLHLIFWNCQD